MNRADFMKNLERLLADVSPAEREEAIQYYNDYFDDAGAENEQSVIASLGTPEQLARTIKAGLSDSGNAGEFTEKGFTGYEQKQSDEVLDIHQASNEEKSRQDGNSQQFNSSNAYGYRQADSGYTGYQSSYGYQGNQGNQGNQSNQIGKENKKMSGATLVLIVILCIFASPFLLGIGAGAIGIIIGILSALLACVIGFGAAAIALIASGVGLFVCGITMLFGMPLGGLCLMGVGMICAAIGLVFAWIIVMMVAWLIPVVIRGIVKLFQSIFHKGGATA